jgi:hypothetical protein
MKDIQAYLKGLNPKDNSLIYGCEYKLYRDGKYIGIGTWTKDENVGDSFQKSDTNEDGTKDISVLIPDRWEINISNLSLN